MADGRTARWAGHRDRRRSEFVAAAVTVLEREGPAATVEQIAAELGVTRQAVYRQFADRADLDRAIAEHAAGLLVQHLTPHLDVEAGVEAGVRRALTAYLDFVQRHLSLYRFVRAHDVDPGGGGAGAVRRVKYTVTDAVAGLARGFLAATGDQPLALADTFAVGLVGMADAVVSAWLDDPRGLSREQVVDQLVQLLVGAVAAVLPDAVVAGEPVR